MPVLEAVQRGLMLFIIVFLVLAVLYLLILLFSRVIRFLESRYSLKKPAVLAAQESHFAPESEEDIDGPWGGTLQLKNADEQTAAMIMAIVSDESGIPLSELIFKRISLVRENESTGEAVK